MDSVDQILRDHGLTRENAKQYVARCAAYNKLDISKDTGLSEDTVHRYKREFQEMETVIRLRVICALGVELHNEIADDKLEVTMRDDEEQS